MGTREKAIEAGARALAEFSADPFWQMYVNRSTAALNALLGVLAEAVADDEGEVLQSARKAVHDGANALGRVAWDVDAERAVSAALTAMKAWP